MRFHCLKHVPFEGPEKILSWARANGHPFTTTDAFREQFPEDDAFDVLVLMGGSMSANDDTRLPWMAEEKRLIQRALSQDKKILGVCLGAQLAASVLGATVRTNPEPEMGWFPVTMTPESREYAPFQELPPTFTPFHWHGETFDLPSGAVRMSRSEACENQGFLYGDRVLGLQFHMEGTAFSLMEMMEVSRHEMVPAPFVQSEKSIREGVHLHLEPLDPLFHALMEGFFSQP